MTDNKIQFYDLPICFLLVYHTAYILVNRSFSDNTVSLLKALWPGCEVAEIMQLSV